MIELKLETISEIVLGLNDVLPKVKGKTGFRMMRILKHLKPLLKDYEEDKYLAATQFAKKNEYGHPEIVEEKFQFETPQTFQAYVDLINDIGKKELVLDIELISFNDIQIDLVDEANPVTGFDLYRIEPLLKD